MFLWKPFGRAAPYWKKLTLRYFVFLWYYFFFIFYIYIYIYTNHPNHREIVTRKMSSESAVSNKVSSRQPPAPIFSSDLDNRTRSSHSGLVYGIKNLEKSWNFKTTISKSGFIWKKSIKPESFGKVMEIYFTILCIKLFVIISWISVGYCAYILLLIPAAFNLKWGKLLQNLY